MRKSEGRTCERCRKAFTVGGRYADKQHRGIRFCSGTCAATSRHTTVEHFWDKNGATKCLAWDALREKVFDRDGRKCVFCGRDKNLQAHHILPREYGKDHKERNLVASCRQCHGSIDRVAKLIARRHGREAMAKKIKILMRLIR